MSSTQRLVAISGLPGSGKSVLVEALGRTLEVPVVGMDAFYRPAPPGGWVDFSDPANLDVDAVLERDAAAGDEATEPRSSHAYPPRHRMLHRPSRHH